MTEASRHIAKLILHCSASPDNRDIGVAEIRDWHVHGNGWKDIGYHFVVRRDGRIEEGRPVSEVGAHCHGQNADSIGICWVGMDHITNAQYAALLRICRSLIDRYGLSVDHVFGHREFDPNKTCPRLPMDSVRHYLANFTGTAGGAAQ